MAASLFGGRQRVLSLAGRLIRVRSQPTFSVLRYVRQQLRFRASLLSRQGPLRSVIGRLFGGASSLGLGLCALPVKNVKETKTNVLPDIDPGSLSSTSLIQNAAAMTVDASSALLTQTFLAVVDKYKQLAKDIETLMEFLQQHRLAEKMGLQTDDLWQGVIQARVNVDDCRQELQELEAILNSALITLDAASEAAFQAGNEDLAMMGRDRCQYANNQLAIMKAVVQQVEKTLVKLQADCIRETKIEDDDDDDEDKKS